MASNGRVPPFTEPFGGWKRWKTRSDHGRQLLVLIESGAIDDGMSALDIQIKHPQFQVYNPTAFSKNLSRLRKDINIKASGAASPVMPPPPAAPHPGTAPMPPVPPPPNPYAAENVPNAIPTANAVPVQQDRRSFGENEFRLPHILTTWHDSLGQLHGSVQIHCLSGTPMKFEMQGTRAVGFYMMSDNFTDSDFALGSFKGPHGTPTYGEGNVRRVEHDMTVNNMRDENDECVWKMYVDLPVPMYFVTRDGFKTKYISFKRSGEVHLYLNLIDNDVSKVDQKNFRQPPSHVSVTSGASHTGAMDDMTAQFSHFGTSASQQHGSGHANNTNESYTYMTMDDSTSRQSRHSQHSHRSRNTQQHSVFGGNQSLAGFSTTGRSAAGRSAAGRSDTGRHRGVPAAVAAAAAAGASALADDRSTAASINSSSRPTKRSRAGRNGGSNNKKGSLPSVAPSIETVSEDDTGDDLAHASPLSD